MLRIPATLEQYSSLKDKSLKLVFETIEPTPEQITEIGTSLQSAGYLVFSNDNFNSKEIDDIKALRADFTDKKKSPSNRLRNVLFLNFESNKEKFESFEDYYKHKMEIIINHYKSKLP